MNIISILPLSALLISLILGIVIIIKSPKIRLNQLFFGLSIASGIYNFSQIIYMNSTDPEKVLFWTRMSFTGAILLFPLIYHLYQEFFASDKKTTRFVYVLYIISLALLVLNFTPYMFSEIKYYGDTRIVHGGKGILAASLFIGGTLISLIIAFIREFFNTDESAKKNRMKYLAVGAVFFVIGGVIDIARRVSYFVLFPYPVASIGIILFMCFLAYTILRHKLLDIQIFFNYSLLYSITMIILAILFLVVEELCEFFLSSFAGASKDSKMVNVVSALFIAALFYPIRIFVVGFLEKLRLYEKKNWWNTSYHIPPVKDLSEDDIQALNNLKVQISNHLN